VTVAWAGKPLVVAVRPNVGFTLEEVSREDSSIGAVFVASDGSTDRLVASWTGATFVCHNTQGVPTSDSTGPSGDRPISAPPTTASVPPTAPTTPPCPPSTVPHPGARDHDTARGGADIGQRTSHRTTITTPAAPHARSSTLGPAPVLLLRAGRPTAADA
jgi:hypothetical protein